MNEEIIEINTGTDLNDSEFLGHEYDRTANRILLKFRAWDASLIDIYFYDPILFVDRVHYEMRTFCERKSPSAVLNDALNDTYAKIPNDHPYHLYQLLDVDDDPAIEIVCERIKVERVLTK